MSARPKLQRKVSIERVRFLEQFYNLERMDELISRLKRKHEEGFKPADLVQLSVLRSYLDHLLRQYR